MTEPEKQYAVMINELFLCGLGDAYDGYRTKTGERPVGYVFSKEQRFALIYSNMEDAKKAAKSFAGQVKQV